jgi:surface antigen
MASASTKRRQQAARALYRKYAGTPAGTPVSVHRDNGERLETVTISEPFLLENAYALVQVKGIPGNVRLSRVKFSRGEG